MIILVERDSDDNWRLQYNHAGDMLTQQFQPDKILMVPDTGRVYHPGPGHCGGVGLISDKLAIQWTQEHRFVFGDTESDAPIGFIWDDTEHVLDNSLLSVIEADKQRGIGIL